jgi:hypothetical protein
MIPPTSVGHMTSILITGLDSILAFGYTYYVMITCVNHAGLSSISISPPVTIVTPPPVLPLSPSLTLSNSSLSLQSQYRLLVDEYDDSKMNVSHWSCSCTSDASVMRDDMISLVKYLNEVITNWLSISPYLEWSLGTVKGGTQLHSFTSLSSYSITSIRNGHVSILNDASAWYSNLVSSVAPLIVTGRQYWFTLVASDELGWSTNHYESFIFDCTPPTIDYQPFIIMKNNNISLFDHTFTPSNTLIDETLGDASDVTTPLIGRTLFLHDTDTICLYLPYSRSINHTFVTGVGDGESGIEHIELQLRGFSSRLSILASSNDGLTSSLVTKWTTIVTTENITSMVDILVNITNPMTNLTEEIITSENITEIITTTTQISHDYQSLCINGLTLSNAVRSVTNNNSQSNIYGSVVAVIYNHALLTSISRPLFSFVVNILPPIPPNDGIHFQFPLSGLLSTTSTATTPASLQYVNRRNTSIELIWNEFIGAAIVQYSYCLYTNRTFVNPSTHTIETMSNDDIMKRCTDSNGWVISMNDTTIPSVTSLSSSWSRAISIDLSAYDSLLRTQSCASSYQLYGMVCASNEAGQSNCSRAIIITVTNDTLMSGNIQPKVMTNSTSLGYITGDIVTMKWPRSYFSSCGSENSDAIAICPIRYWLGVSSSSFSGGVVVSFMDITNNRD